MVTDHPESRYIEELNDSLVRVGEKGCSAVFRNKERKLVRRILIDGGLIQEGVKADYIVSEPSIVDVIVELKRSHTSEGIEQIRTTREFWIKHRLAGERLGALIVRGNKIHPKEQANLRRWKIEFRSKFSIRLLIESRNREYEFSEFVLSEIRDV